MAYTADLAAIWRIKNFKKRLQFTLKCGKINTLVFRIKQENTRFMNDDTFLTESMAFQDVELPVEILTIFCVVFRMLK